MDLFLFFNVEIFGYFNNNFNNPFYNIIKKPSKKNIWKKYVCIYLEQLELGLLIYLLFVYACYNNHNTVIIDNICDLFCLTLW